MRRRPPCAYDIPQVLNVSLLVGNPNPGGVLRSKACGEPPMALANSVYLAVKDAIYSARADASTATGTDYTGFVQLPVPLTVQEISKACLATTSPMPL